MKTRNTQRSRIQQFFSDFVGERFDTYDLHARFGSAFRSRVSEINRSDSDIVIRNETEGNHSVYFSERRAASADL